MGSTEQVEEFREDFPCTLDSVGRARHALVNYAFCAGLNGITLADFECAIGEALANAAEHGYRDNSRFSVKAYVQLDMVTVEIKDGGNGFAGWSALEHLQPKSLSPRGFGIFIMRSLMDGVQYSEGGSRIRLTKKIPSSGYQELQREA